MSMVGSDEGDTAHVADEASHEDFRADEKPHPAAVFHPDQPDSEGLVTRSGKLPDSGLAAESLDDYGDDESEGDQRKGRFYGPDSSWRYYTRDERALAATFDQAEANDLSIHLYNAHAWKANLYKSGLDSDIKPWLSKRRWLQTGANGNTPFHPRPEWTAWPLKPEDVPRSREKWGIPTVYSHDDPETFHRVEPWTPSKDLEEEIKAMMLRKAKERFLQRALEQPEKPALLDPVKAFSASPAPSSVSSYDPSEASDSDEPSKEDDEPKPFVKPGNSPDLSPDPNESEPVFIADDEVAGSLLQPATRHILSKLDSLLIGLHKSRLGHRQCGNDGGESRTASMSRSRSRAKSSSRVPSKRKRIASDASAQHNRQAGASDSEQDPSEDDRPRRNVRGGHKPLNLRDWSEVLGMASMLGWDQSVLDRTARRCATLFGEGVSMRIMPETSSGQTQDHVLHYVPGQLPKLPLPHRKIPTIVVSSDDDEDDDDSTGYHCPHASCRRHLLPYEKRWRLHEHLKRKHQQTEVEIGDELETQNAAEEDDASTTDADVKRIKKEESESEPGLAKVKGGHRCPHVLCPRHEDPYRERWRLNEHLKRNHRKIAVEVDETEHMDEEEPAEAADREVTLEAKLESKDAGAASRRVDFAPRALRNDFLQPITLDVPALPRRRRFRHRSVVNVEEE